MVGVVGDGGADDVAERLQPWFGPRELLVRVGPPGLVLERTIEGPVVHVSTGLELSVVDGLVCHSALFAADAMTVVLI